VDRLDRVSCIGLYSPLINVDKTNVTGNDGIACRILIQNEQLEQVDTFQYLGSLIRPTEDGWVYDGIPYQVKHGPGDKGVTAENMDKNSSGDEIANVNILPNSVNNAK